MDIINDKEELELEKAAENTVLLSALKKIFLSDIYCSGNLSKEPMEEQYKQNFAYSLSFDPRTGQEYARTNEDLGKALRAVNEALRIINLSFQKIDKHKKVVEIQIDKSAKHR